MRRSPAALPVLVILLVLVSLAGAACLRAERDAGPDPTASTAPASSPSYDSTFWEHWGDGKAELAGYRFTIDRYGDERSGTAVAIFVTEPFSEEARVKANRPGPGTFPAIKLNLVEDFPTGIYDYNVMTSAFVALEAVAGLPAGAPAKVSFSSQEWCGHVYHQALFAGDEVRETLHSYFEGEADRAGTLPGHAGGVSEDALLLWARGLAYPAVAPGESTRAPLFTSLKRARLAHLAAGWEEVELARAGATEEVTVPAGTFVARRATARATGAAEERTWTFIVEEASPHRIVAWETSDGERAELLGSDRLAYWELNGPGGESYLERFGLQPRGEGMP